MEAAANVRLRTLRPSMQKAREDGLPRIPHSLSELAQLLRDEDNEHITKTLDGEDSLFAGVVGNSNNRTRSILFFSRRNLKYMGSRHVKKVFCDGTFTIPNDLGCSQVWTLITLRRHHVSIQDKINF